MRTLIIASFILVLIGCAQHKEKVTFELMKPSQTGVVFTNEVYNSKDFNIFSYRNFYNGGGVAIGDINNDNLPDLFFTSNLGSNKLFLNKGNFEFEDLSSQAGIESSEKWSTGVVMVDINTDGYLDIYVCNAGYREESGQGNQLFINNKDLTFTESAASYGLNDSGYTTHAGFFDYDMDGDLDVYILNNSFIPVNTLNYSNKRDLKAADWPVKDFLKGGGDKLLRNDGGNFVDVSAETGIYGSLIGFGLGVTLGDVNDDQWPDIYVSNDFFERDYLYINQKNGTFSEELNKRIKHLSLSSMGADMADINNDGLPEIFVTDMLPGEEYRLKTTSSFENIDVHRLKIQRGFYYQFMQNTLQLNNGEGNFKEISYFSGVAASDWSWGALMFDADNDGLTDIYVCNGIYHDVIDQDFIDFFANEIIQEMAITGQKETVDSIINKMPSVPVVNKFFKNKGNLQFEDIGESWGFDEASFSNGAAYGDLDNDGDLDLVINNVNQPAFVYRNNLTSSNHFLKVKLKGPPANPFAIGSVVNLYSGNEIFSRQVIPTRGFQSSVDYVQTIGLGEVEKIDSMVILWPDLNKSIKMVEALDTTMFVNYDNETKDPYSNEITSSEALLSVTSNPFEPHQEDDYVDFYYERNIPIMLSREGPVADVGDINGDGEMDLFIGGAANQAGQLYFGTSTGYKKSDQSTFQNFASYEDTAVCFFDSDGDGDLDLFVGSGGNRLPFNARQMQDRIYINEGNGIFRPDAYALPNSGMNTSVAIPYDFDQDGRMDLFVGSRSVPGDYGLPPISFLYKNNGRGRFRDFAKTENRELRDLGMVTDAIWIDLVSGPHKELVVVGEWMAPRIFQYNGVKYVEIESNLSAETGWWQTVDASDVDNDGDQDLLLGNIGLNFYLSASVESPLKLWINDYDENGSIEKIITRTINGKDMPVPLKRDMVDQVAALKKENLKHKDYATKSIQELFSLEKIEQSLVKNTTTLASVIAINEGQGNFKTTKLPTEVQLSCTNDGVFTDLNNDGAEDLILGGNNYHFAPQFSRLDASNGHVLVNDGSGNFTVLMENQSGLNLDGQVQQFIEWKKDSVKYILALINDQAPFLYTVTSK